MKTEWDYSSLANAYLERPDYSPAAIDAMLAVSQVQTNDSVCDVGAGVAHLTLMLGAKQLQVTAVEPNDAMRANGIKRTESFSNIKWHEGTGENTGQASAQFSLVTFGSSFNVCDRPKALAETARLLTPGGWFACMWNHRDLKEPIQAEIESIITGIIPSYGYGTRREDQSQIIEASNLFGAVVHLDAKVVHQQSVEKCIEAWRSHATLERQAAAKFPVVIDAISKFLLGLKKESISIPYSTNIWMAQLK
ncbi:class I SAM-dependent methyltransferase [Shewanella sp. SNU WT4]|uniref:class I SAM-dependent methyltransferase n=1 Tax=Shewanella sp. SNU WT4 TaxID=2590015 RepID=UPI00112D4C86|nr:methyltransferase domain-containing protein [Shewanella sp. SNU WT4]QDF66528.1 class I SAM-dependent methyltransferase [Shewanella sp. SNU WT4]